MQKIEITKYNNIWIDIHEVYYMFIKKLLNNLVCSVIKYARSEA